MRPSLQGRPAGGPHAAERIVSTADAMAIVAVALAAVAAFVSCVAASRAVDAERSTQWARRHALAARDRARVYVDEAIAAGAKARGIDFEGPVTTGPSSARVSIAPATLVAEWALAAFDASFADPAAPPVPAPSRRGS